MLPDLGKLPSDSQRLSENVFHRGWMSAHDQRPLMRGDFL